MPAMPHSLESEQAVLGSLMLAGDRLGRSVIARLGADVRVFFWEGHREIYRAIRHLWNNGNPTDLGAVLSRLDATEKTDEAGGRGAVAAIFNSVADPDGAPYHAEVVADKARLRGLIYAAQEIMDLAYNAEDATEAVERAESLIYPFRPPQSAQDVTGIGCLSGFPAIDGIVGGFRPGNLIVVAALTSVGKTAFALAVARNVACGAGGQSAQPVLYVSLEMSAAELATRLMCAEKAVSTARARRGSLTDDDWDRLVNAQLEVMNDWPLWIEDRRGLTVAEMARLARDLGREKRGRVGLVVVDYLGLVGARSSKASRSREQEVAEISRSLKAMAGEIGSPVMALSQFSRGAEADKDGPSLRHLRDSGSIEADADLVMLLTGDKASKQRTAKIAKNRGGPLGDLELYFAGRYTRIEGLVGQDWRPAV